MRASDKELSDIVDEACSTRISRTIIPQYFPQRSFLWRGTLLWRIVPRDIASNMVVSLAVVGILQGLPGLPGRYAPSWLPSWLSTFLPSVDRVWIITSGLVGFTLSFFLSQAYGLWRSVYSACRSVQCSINTIGLLCATAAEREPDGSYTDDAIALLIDMARLWRLFHILLYSRYTTRFSPLATPRGLRALARRGVLTDEEVSTLLESSQGHHAVLEWIVLLFNSALADGRLCAGNGSGGLPLPLANGFREEMCHLRKEYVHIFAALSGRAPSAYVQLVQIMTDVLVGLTPFALMHSVGGIGAVLGTGLTTLFYSSILVLAKMLLDPFDNDRYGGGGGISINVATLLQEVNVDSERWRKAATYIPSVAKQRQQQSQQGE